MRIVRLFVMAEISFPAPLFFTEHGLSFCVAPPQACAFEPDWNNPAKAGRRQHGHRQRHVTVDQQKYRCDDLKREDHPQVMRGVQGAHELSCNASRRGKWNEVQEAVQAENKKDHARQISGNCGSGSHNRVLLLDWRHSMTSSILKSIELIRYTS